MAITPRLDQWFPVAASTDLPLRHVYQGQLWGRELAIWRADDGFVNAWENRCLHRGVRLSVGLNDGHELKCLYHGWRYANRTAGCTYIPAHPADAPARTICNRTYDAHEAHGLIWCAIAPTGAPQIPAALSRATDPLVLRALPVHAPADLLAQLSGGTRPQDQDTAAPLQLEAGGDTALLFLQPADAGRTILHGVIPAPVGDPEALLRRWNRRLTHLRDLAEEAAQARPAPMPFAHDFAPVDAALASPPARSTSGPRKELRVTVARKWQAARDICGFRLAPLSGTLPTPQPGAHIDIGLPNGMTRQYSLLNGPGETAAYEIGVKLDRNGEGGSALLHGSIREGDVLAISAPRNMFPLRRDSEMTLLIAGGIGITPMLAMAQALQVQGLPYRLHYFARSTEDLAFDTRLASLGDNLETHLGLTPDATQAALAGLLARPAFAHHLYVCGPGAMLDQTRALAARAGWPEASVHFEYFSNPNQIDMSGTFEVALARSALTLQVPPGQSLLAVLRDNGVDLPSSCEQGACGTCRCGVLEGEVDHQDVCLGAQERADTIITCVSRARSDRLVLDL